MNRMQMLLVLVQNVKASSVLMHVGGRHTQGRHALTPVLNTNPAALSLPSTRQLSQPPPNTHLCRLPL